MNKIVRILDINELLLYPTWKRIVWMCPVINKTRNLEFCKRLTVLKT